MPAGVPPKGLGSAEPTQGWQGQRGHARKVRGQNRKERALLMGRGESRTAALQLMSLQAEPVAVPMECVAVPMEHVAVPRECVAVPMEQANLPTGLPASHRERGRGDVEGRVERRPRDGNVQNIRGIWERKGKAHFARGTTSVVWGPNICRREHGGRAFWENISDIIPTVSGVLRFGYKWPSNVFVRFVLLVPGAHRDPGFVLTWEINHSLDSMAEFSCVGKGGGSGEGEICVNAGENQPESLCAMCCWEEGAARIPGERLVVPRKAMRRLRAEGSVPSTEVPHGCCRARAGAGGAGGRGGPRRDAVSFAARRQNESDVRQPGCGHDGSPVPEPQRRERQRGTSPALWCGRFIVSPSCL